MTSCYIANVVVEKPFRGLGLGAAMVRRLESLALDHNPAIALFTLTAMQEPLRNLQTFYEELGYHVDPSTPAVTFDDGVTVCRPYDE